MNEDQLLELAIRCEEIIRKARKDLGHDLYGSSCLDLCCDNTSASIANLRKALELLGEK